MSSAGVERGLTGRVYRKSPDNKMSMPSKSSLLMMRLPMQYHFVIVWLTKLLK